eukprot:TCONS_00030032-protein
MNSNAALCSSDTNGLANACTAQAIGTNKYDPVNRPINNFGNTFAFILHSFSCPHHRVVFYHEKRKIKQKYKHQGNTFRNSIFIVKNLQIMLRNKTLQNLQKQT